jgi:predicted RNase H-like nuclease (RuvC/YqgF family)
MDMKGAKLRSCRLAAFFLFSLQSLADIAREEAERRKLLEQQGIEAKVIEGDPRHFAPNGNLTLSTPKPSSPKKEKTKSASSKGQPSVRSFRTALQRLDRTIRKDQERLDLLRTRLHSEKWAIPKVGRISKSVGKTDSQSRLQREIEDLESKLKRLRRERSEIYDAGRKAGFLPGELDGKGIIP